MRATILCNALVHSDPELQVGDVLTLERADGRSVWRQRLMVMNVSETVDARHYMLWPAEDIYQGERSC